MRSKCNGRSARPWDDGRGRRSLVWSGTCPRGGTSWREPIRGSWACSSSDAAHGAAGSCFGVTYLGATCPESSSNWLWCPYVWARRHAGVYGRDASSAERNDGNERFAVPSTSEEALPEPSVSRGRVLIPSGVPTRVVKPSCSAEVVPRAHRPEGSLKREDKGSESMGAVGSRAAAHGDVAHVCKALETTAGDLWLVDSGATCHIVSDRHLSGFRVVKKHDRTANLFNASGGSISVAGVVDLEVHFGDVFLRLEEVLVADVGFNVLSPWTGAERGWKTYLAKNGSRLYKGNKKSIKLLGAQRAWWAVSGNKKGKSKRQPRGGVGDMELDALEKCTTGAPPGLCSDLGSGPPGPRSILKGKKEGSEERGARNCLRDTPFSFMLRGFRSDFPLERDLPRIPETLEEVSGNRALRNFARKVFGMIFSIVFGMISGMSLGMVFGMIFGMIRSNFGMFCSMFGSMFCSMFVSMFLSMFGWMVKEVVMIQCGDAASILEIAALRGSLLSLASPVLCVYFLWDHGPFPESP